MNFCLAILTSVILANKAESAVDGNKTQIHILGLYPMSGGWAGGEALLPATQLALKHINANESILADFELIVDVGDTKVSARYTQKWFCTMLKVKEIVLGLDPKCSRSRTIVPIW